MRTNKQKNRPLKVAGHIFGLIATANLLRLIFSTEIMLSGHVVSMSVSMSDLLLLCSYPFGCLKQAIRIIEDFKATNVAYVHVSYSQC